MVEYALLVAGSSLRTFALRAAAFGERIDWAIVVWVVGGLLAVRLGWKLITR